MKTLPATSQRKRPVNLTLSDEVVAAAKRHSDNLSATVESLLADFARRQDEAAAQQHRHAQACASEWNAVNDSMGSFADEHSTL